MDKVINQNTNPQIKNNQMEFKNLFQIISEEFRDKLNEFQFFSLLFNKYLSIMNKYKENISKTILIPLQNKFKYFGNFFSIFRQILEIQLSFIDRYNLLMNKIRKVIEIEEKRNRINELIENLEKLFFDDDFLILNQKKQDYNNQLNYIENLIIQNEISQKNEMLLEIEITKGKSYESSYLDYINIINNKQKQFLNEGNEKIKEIISINKSIYNDLGLFSHSIGKGFIIQLEEELKNLQELISGIEKNLNLNMLITQQEKHLKIISMNEIRFIPYSMKIFEIMEKEKYSRTKKITSNNYINIVTKMKNNFKQIAEFFNEETEREKNYILEEAKYLLDSLTTSEIEKAKFNKLLNLLNNREYRLFFMTSLNKIRAEGNFEICFYGTFKQLGKILKFILEKIKKEKDYQIMSYVIIISQTYYCFDINNKKIYLIKYIDNDEIFQSKEFWNCYFQEIMAIDNKVNKENCNEEDNDKNIKDPNVVFSKLLPIIHNMLEFKFNKNDIKEFVKEYREKYSIKEEMIEQILLLVGDKEYDINEIFDEEKCFNKNINSNKIENETKNFTNDNICQTLQNDFNKADEKN